MNWRLDKKRPICPQICEKLCIMIASGELEAGERLTSVRDVAVSAGVNPNTVQKSFEQLEQQGMIYSKRGSGWYVSDRADTAREILEDLVHEKTAEYLNDMEALGFGKKEIIGIIKDFRYK